MHGTGKKSPKTQRSICSDHLCFIERQERPLTVQKVLRKAAEIYVKSGKADAAEPLFLRSCEILEDTGKAILGVDTFRATLNFLVSKRKWKAALAFTERMVSLYKEIKQPSNVYKMYLSIVVLNLARNDYVAAKGELDKHFNDTGYLKSAECEAAEEILIAWKNCDDVAVEELLRKKAAFKYLDREIGKLARKLNPRGTVSDSISSGMSSLRVTRGDKNAQQGSLGKSERSGVSAPTSAGKAALFAPSAKKEKKAPVESNDKASDDAVDAPAHSKEASLPNDIDAVDADDEDDLDFLC